MAGEWTEERRQKARERIKRDRPWMHSTGPKTPEGKAKSSLNSYKTGERSLFAQDVRVVLDLNNQTIMAHQLFMVRAAYLKERIRNGGPYTNELIKKMNENNDLSPLCPHPPPTAN